ncbi:hypothetical protein M0D69_13735 [Caballeronia sp. SEWSISQ10-4 2]|uniref:hypothetical protein n=1 Tax=Caballeronia sp. SEWSISQ10-4 2 TaxID=2937438 RepID=UPI00264C0508|nr:hypothetical protein [Caballeronia sp. SEWSISQ10-4 2]MDN7179054.1 hypothetical protein [Caballeronia sp. SEWSISQ10-4 2]
MSFDRKRLLLDMVKDAGLEVVTVGMKNNRVAVDARAGNGLTATFQLSTSSKSDPRGDMNENGRIKRFARQNPAPGAAPQIEEEEAMSNTTPAAKELTQIEFYRLCEWLKIQDLATYASLEVLTAAAARICSHNVSEATVREAMTATGVTDPEVWTAIPDPQIVLARELAAIQYALGHEPSSLFRRYLETLGA